MQLTTFRARTTSLFLALVLALSMMLGMVRPQPAYGQTTGHKMKSFARKHRTATSLAAGYAAYKIAKKTGANRAAHGGRMNAAQRHPFITGMVAAGATHHMLKKKHH